MRTFLLVLEPRLWKAPRERAAENPFARWPSCRSRGGVRSRKSTTPGVPERHERLETEPPAALEGFLSLHRDDHVLEIGHHATEVRALAVAPLRPADRALLDLPRELLVGGEPVVHAVMQLAPAVFLEPAGATRLTTPRPASLSTTLLPYLQNRFRSIGHFRTVYELRYVSQKWWSSRKWNPRMQSAAHIGATESHFVPAGAGENRSAPWARPLRARWV